MSANRRSLKNISRWSKLKEQAKVAATTPEQPAVSQRTLDRVTKERDELSKKLDAALTDNAKLKNSLCNVTKKVMDITNPTPFLTGSEKDPSEVSEQEVIEMIDRLIPVEKNESLESRIEELETRITLLNGELGKLLKLKLNLEAGLKQLGSCTDLDTMRQTVRHLWLQSCTTKLFAGESLRSSDSESDQKSSHLDKAQHNGIPLAVQINLKQVQIAPPTGTKKAPDTHIKNMQPELRQLVVQELSLYKNNGADWRMFAQRVGVPDTLLTQWQQMRVDQPMKNVLGVWAASPGATVRMLHRHLVSPQMRCILLGKRISDYYEVD